VPISPDPQSPPEQAANEGDVKAQLAAMAQTGNQTRLSPSDEDRATKLMKDCILGGSDGIAAALDAMPRLPWILGVRAIENAWPGLDGDSRAQILEGLTKIDTDSGYRLRLSLARALARPELPVAVKVAADACRAMWKNDSGTLAPEHSKLIGNVFIGRGKPWVLQLPLADLAEPDANAVVSCVVFSAFNINNPPITQLSVLRYAAGRLGSLHENLAAMVARSVGRWGGKWQAALRKEVADLPEPIVAALKTERSADTPAAADEDRQSPPDAESSDAGTRPPEEAGTAIPPELNEKLKAAAESGDTAAVEAVTQEINSWREAQRIARLEALDEDEDDEDDDTAEDEAVTTDEPRDRRDRRGRDRKERPAYVSREQESRGVPGFNYSTAIKQLDNYVTGLRNELATAQARLRRAEDESRRPRRESADRPILSHEEASLSPDELKRLVIQLENRAAELKARVEELTADSEARAFAMAAGTTEASPDPVTQLRTLLALKLQDDYADFLALEKESPDFVVQQHYRSLIRHVFQVLASEQVPLRVPEEPIVVPPLPPQIPG